MIIYQCYSLSTDAKPSCQHEALTTETCTTDCVFIYGTSCNRTSSVLLSIDQYCRQTEDGAELETDYLGLRKFAALIDQYTESNNPTVSCQKGISVT